MTHYVITVDGGGTKTKGCAHKTDGTLLEHVTTGFSNVLIDLETATQNILYCVKACLQLGSPEVVVLGIAGSANPKVHGEFKRHIVKRIHLLDKRLKDVPVDLMDDLKLSYYAAFKGKDGILGLLGTGSAFLTRQSGEWLRVGAYGHILGDEGSGYALAKETVKEAIRRGYLGETSLQERICKFYKLDDFEEIKDVVYRSPKGLLASLSVKTFEWEAEENLTGIIDLELDHLTDLFAYLIYQLKDQDEPFKLFLIGGMVQNNLDYAQRVIKRLTTLNASLTIEVVQKSFDACEGGIYVKRRKL